MRRFVRRCFKFVHIATLDLDKMRLIDFAFKNLQFSSFLDLGGVWNVNGGYSIYALKQPGVEFGVLVDTDFTEAVMAKKAKYPKLKLIKGNFGDQEVAQQVGAVDVAFLFDVLLHQVNPNWDEILELYANRTNCFLIFNPQYIASNSTVRLLDLGEEEYFNNVPHKKDGEPYRSVFQKMYEIHPQHGRVYRDIHNIWQWGIVDNDLTSKMEKLGFSLRHYQNCGRFQRLKNFEKHAFVFCREQTTEHNQG